MRIEAWDRVRITEVFYHQIKVDKSIATLEAEVEMIATEDIPSAQISIKAEGVEAKAPSVIK